MSENEERINGAEVPDGDKPSSASVQELSTAYVVPARGVANFVRARGVVDAEGAIHRGVWVEKEELTRTGNVFTHLSDTVLGIREVKSLIVDEFTEAELREIEQASASIDEHSARISAKLAILDHMESRARRELDELEAMVAQLWV